MSSEAIVALAAFISMGSAVLLVAHVVQSRSAAARRRLQLHSVAVATSEAHRLERIQVLKSRGIGDAMSGGSKLGGSKMARTAALELPRAGLSTSVRRYLQFRMVFGVVLAVIAQVVTSNLLIATVALVAGMMLPRIVVRQKGKRRLRAFEAQLAESIDLLVGALRAGHGFLQGLESVASQMDEPMKGELARVLEEVNVGINPVEALTAMTVRIPSYDVALLVSAIAVQRQTGGNLAEVLENLAATVRERRRIRAEVRALTTGPRVSAYILAAIPVGLFFYFILISADYRDTMLNTTFGHMLLGLVAVLTTLGFITTSKVAKVEY